MAQQQPRGYPRLDGSDTSGGHHNYRHKQVYWLGITQVVLGFLCITFQFVAIYFGATSSVLGAGIWSGICFVIAGAFGIVSSQRKTTAWIIAAMVLSTVSSGLTLSIVTIASIGIALDDHCYFDKSWNCDKTKYDKIGMNTALLVLAFLEAVVSIWTSAVCCSEVCCGKTKSGSVPCDVGYEGPNTDKKML